LTVFVTNHTNPHALLQLIVNAFCRILLYQHTTNGIYGSHDSDHDYYTILGRDAAQLGRNFYHTGLRQYLDNGNSFCTQLVSTVTRSAIKLGVYRTVTGCNGGDQPDELQGPQFMGAI